VKFRGKEQLCVGAMVNAHVAGQGKLKPDPRSECCLIVSGAVPQSVTSTDPCMDEPRVATGLDVAGKADARTGSDRIDERSEPNAAGVVGRSSIPVPTK
jgi:hypothetical protein